MTQERGSEHTTPPRRLQRLTEQDRDPGGVSAVASALLQWRLGAGLTQAEVARTLGVTTAVYGSYERGQTTPPATLLRRIILLWQADPYQLLALWEGHRGDPPS